MRILFVFAALASDGTDTDVRLLARHLDRSRYRIDVVVCFRPNGASDRAVDRLRQAGLSVDTVPYHLSFDATVGYLAGRVPGYDIVVSCQNVADIYPALERLHLRPPLIEQGRQVAEALAGPKHFTTRYVGTTAAIRDAAAARMPGREPDAVVIPVMKDLALLSPAAIVAQWQRLFDAVRRPAPASPAPLFQSFWQGGFECSSHRRAQDRRRIDVIAATRHDALAEADYRALHPHGIRTVRDGLRWHRIERTPGRYDWSSLDTQLAGAAAAGTELIWDLLHYGWPDDLDIWSPAFVTRFAAFAAAAAARIGPRSPGARFYCPVNEISFLAWGGGEVGYLNPFAHGRGFELKVQLARAAIAAMDAIRAVDPAARFVHVDPVVNIVADPARPGDAPFAEGHRQAQFQGWDLIAGRIWPQIGGRPDLLDIIGVNYYHTNQWTHGGASIDRHHPSSKPFRAILAETYARYGRPIFVAETGIEGDERAAWFLHIAEEVRAAERLGIPVQGICLYPVLDHPGWDDDRPCPNGLLHTLPDGSGRRADPALAAALRIERSRRTTPGGVMRRDPVRQPAE